MTAPSSLPPSQTGRRAVALVLATLLAWFFVDAYFFEGTAVVIHCLVLLMAMAGVWSLAGEPCALRTPGIGPLLAAVAGAATGHLLSAQAALHPALAASLAGTAVSVLPWLGLKRVSPWVPAFYVGVFGGTGAAVILHGAPWVLLAGLLGGWVWALIPDAWSGVGGKMGFSAWIGAGAAVLLSEHLAGNKPAVLSMQVIDLEHTLAVPIAAIAALVTRRLMHRGGLPAVAASALPTACVASALFLLRIPMAAPLAAAWFGGSFVGMTPRTRVSSDAGIAAIGALFGVVWLHLQSAMVGWAGVLGATACACVLAGIGTAALWRRVSAACDPRPSGEMG